MIEIVQDAKPLSMYMMNPKCIAWRLLIIYTLFVSDVKYIINMIIMEVSVIHDSHVARHYLVLKNSSSWNINPVSMISNDDYCPLQTDLYKMEFSFGGHDLAIILPVFRR